MRIFVTDKIHANGIGILRGHFDVGERYDISPEELVAVIPAYDVLLVRSKTKVTAEVIRAGKNLKAIGRAGVGVDNIDVEAATKAGIPVFNAPTGNIRAVAEHTIALILSLMRQIPQANAGIRKGLWEKNKLAGRELQGKTLGIIGLGKIGSSVAQIAKCLGMNVVGHDPYIQSGDGAPLVGLPELLEMSDVVTIHVPLMTATERLIGPKELALMRGDSYLVNTSRGGVVDEGALFDALESGRIAGAALDVFSGEPPDDPRIARLDNLIVTPHIAGSTHEAQIRTAEEIATTLVNFLIHGKVENIVNPEALRDK